MTFSTCIWVVLGSLSGTTFSYYYSPWVVRRGCLCHIFSIHNVCTHLFLAIQTFIYEKKKNTFNNYLLQK